MCEYDFDWYVEWQETQPWQLSLGGCDCGIQLQPGNTVEVYGGHIDETCCWQCSDEWDDPTHGDGNGSVFVIDDYGNETTVTSRCPTCDGDGFIAEKLSEMRCLNCVAASKVLDRWCDGHFDYGRIVGQLDDHWHEDTIYRSYPFARLLTAGKRHWVSPGSGRIYEPNEVAAMAERVLAGVTPGDTP